MPDSIQQTDITDEIRNQRAFLLSLVSGVIMFIITVIYVFLRRYEPLNNIFADVRTFATLVCLSSFFSAWLAKKGRAVLGVSLILASLYISIFLASLIFSGSSPAMAAILMTVTLGITSTIFPTTLGNRVNIIALFFAALPVLLDILNPFPRIADPSPTITWSLTAVLVIIYGVVLLRQFKNYNLRAKLILAFSVLAILSVAVVAFITNIVVRAQIIQTVGHNISTLASAQANNAAEIVQGNIEDLTIISLNKLVQDTIEASNASNVGSASQLAALDQQWIAADDSDPVVQKVINNDAAQDLREFNAHFSKYVEVLTTDKYGATVSASHRTSRYYQAGQDWWKAAWNQGKGSVYIAKGPVVDDRAGVNTLTIALPIPAHEGTEIVGVLLATIDISQFNANLQASQFENTGAADLIFANGNELSPELTVENVKPATSDLLKNISKTTGLYDFDGIPRLISAFPVILAKKDVNGNVQNLGWSMLVYQDQSEALQPATAATQAELITAILVLFLAVGIAVYFGNSLTAPLISLTKTAQQVAAGDLDIQSDIKSNDEIGLLASTFNNMSIQLKNTLDGLEQRVADRTKALVISSEVSRRLSTILDQKKLVAEVVEQVQGAFNYYHAHIYLMDENTGDLVMAGGTGEAGKTMLARGHKIVKGKGLVGRAAQSNTTVLVSDVSADPQWLPNLLLPETRSEVAVPISIGDRVLGVLDVQQNVAQSLTQEDVVLLQSIANQVGGALQNARAYTKTQAEADREALITAIGQKIQGTTTVESAMQIAIRELGRALNGAKTQIVLNESSGGENIQNSEGAEQ